MPMKAIHKSTLLQLPGRYPVKPRKRALINKLPLLILAIILYVQAAAQCVIQTNIHDTTVIGSGTQQNPPYQFSFPKFDPGLGTLLSVRLVSVVTLSYSFTIENNDVANKNYGVRINREDLLWGPDGFETEFLHTSPRTNYLLAASDGIAGSGPDFFDQSPIFILNQDTAINEEIYNTADFMGAGDVNFTYSTDVGTTMTGGFSVTLQGDAQDEVHFMVIYTYCDNSITLADDIRSFSAIKQNDIVYIRWLTANEQPGTTYELMKSVNGESYTAVKTFAADDQSNGSGEYAYQYVPVNGESGKITFRIKKTGSDGKSTYSELRVVNLDDLKKSGLRLYPNPARGSDVTIVFPDAGPWQLELYNQKGQLALRRQENNTLLTTISTTQNKLPKGHYIVRATNKKNNALYTQRLIIE